MTTDDRELFVVPFGQSSNSAAVDVVGDLDVDVDCATGYSCSSCAIPPRAVGGLR